MPFIKNQRILIFALGIAVSGTVASPFVVFPQVVNMIVVVSYLTAMVILIQAIWKK